MTLTSVGGHPPGDARPLNSLSLLSMSGCVFLLYHVYLSGPSPQNFIILTFFLLCTANPADYCQFFTSTRYSDIVLGIYCFTNPEWMSIENKLMVIYAEDNDDFGILFHMQLHYFFSYVFSIRIWLLSYISSSLKLACLN